MAVLKSEVGSIVAVQTCTGAKTIEARNSHTEISLLNGMLVHANGTSEPSLVDQINHENQRSSGRSRVPTRKLVESSLKDSTRLIFLSTEGDERNSASQSPSNDPAGSRRTSQRRGGAFEQADGGATKALAEGREKRRRGASADCVEGAMSRRSKRTAALQGQLNRESCMEKLLVRRGDRVLGSAKISSRKLALRTSRPGRSSTQSRPAGTRGRPARDVPARCRISKAVSRSRPASERQRRTRDSNSGMSRDSKTLHVSSLRRLPVVKSGTGTKTRLDLTSTGGSSVAPAGRKTVSAPGKAAFRGEDGDDVSTGSSETGSTHRRDWGLMEVDAVGRNRPPFARTMLYHGTVPFALPADLGDQAPARNWVIKRWPDKTNRRKIDQEVHECIKAHPNPHLVRILDVSPSEGVLMDYWNEGDLHKHMTTARRKFMPVKEIARYMQQLLRGLAHLHKHKVVHCDVSPQNVFLRRDREREEQLKLLLKEEASSLGGGHDSAALAQTVYYTCALGDFGHSYILSQHEESRSGVAHQGAEFVAPEVKDGRVSTMASDIFSAGKILSELLNLSESFGDAFEKEPKFMVRKLRGLAAGMCSPAPSARPTALRACQKLDTLGESLH